MSSALSLNHRPSQYCMVMKEQAKALSVLRDSKIKQEKIGSLGTMSLQENKLVASSHTQ